MGQILKEYVDLPTHLEKGMHSVCYLIHPLNLALSESGFAFFYKIQLWWMCMRL